MTALQISRSPVLQVAALGLIVGFPLLTLACLAQTSLWPEVGPSGDLALHELAVWHAVHGTQTTGLAAHEWFLHPGPAYYYLQAPLYWMSGYSSRSLYLSAALINLSAILATLWGVRRLTGPGSLLLWAVLLTAFIHFQGTHAWISFRGTQGQFMPFLLAVVLFAAVAIGRWNYLPAALAVASLPVQQYVAFFPALASVALVAVVLGSLPGLRARLGMQTPNSGRPWPVLVLSLLLLAPMWAMPLFARFPRPPDHLLELVRFFSSHGASHDWVETGRLLIGQVSAFPAYCLSGRREWIPPGIHPALLGILAGVQLLLIAVTYWRAGKAANTGRQAGHHVPMVVGDGRHTEHVSSMSFQRVLCLFSVVLLAACGFSIRRAFGPVSHHQIYWMSVFSLLVFAAAGGPCLSCLAGAGAKLLPRLRRGLPWLKTESHPYRSWAVCAVAILAVVCGSILNLNDACQKPAQLRKEEYDAARDPRRLLDNCLQTMRDAGVRRCLVRIVDHDTWPTAAYLVTTLTKAGFHVAVESAWQTTFGPQHAQTEDVDGTLWTCSSNSPGETQLVCKKRLIILGKTADTVLFWQPADTDRKGIAGGK